MFSVGDLEYYFGIYDLLVPGLRLKFGFYFSETAEFGIMSHQLFVADSRASICSDRCSPLFESNVEHAL